MKSTLAIAILFCAVSSFRATSLAQNVKPSTAASPSETILKLKVPDELRKVWKEWNGKYVLFVHREQPVRQLSDFSGRTLFVAFINSEAIIDDASKLLAAAKIKDCTKGIQNAPDMYDKQFLADPKGVGMMVPEIASHYGFRRNPKLIEVTFE